jgi:hypothetical protein
MAKRSKDQIAVSIGVRTHSAHGNEEGGWAAYVVLSGPLAAPSILSRGRMELRDRKIEGANQPFHKAGAMFPFDHTEPMDLKSAEAFIKRCRKSSQDLAGRMLNEIGSTYGALKTCCVLTGPERPLPPLSGIIASHGAMHGAERVFFRDVVRDAAVQKRIATEVLKEKDLPALAKRLPGTDASRREVLKAFGKQVGSPWSQDEKLAAMAAWLGLARRKSP